MIKSNMQIIHCSDIHIGSAMKSLPAEKAKIRKRELLDSFLRIADFAKEKQVPVVIIAGDLFDNRKVARSIKKEIVDKINSVPEIDFIYLTGNHDKNFEIAYDDDITLPKNLKTFDTPSDWQYFCYDDVCIAGIDIGAQSGTGFYEKLKFDAGKINIAVMHGALGNIHIDRLRGKYIDYLALGDKHSPDLQASRIDARGVYAYSGCLEGCGFDETGDKGFFLLSIDNGKISGKFCRSSKRKHEIIDVDITNCDNHSLIEKAVRNKTDTLDKKNLVRVVLKGKYKADTIKETGNIEKKLNEDFFFAQVKDESVLDRESVDFRNEISLRGEFVNIVDRCDLNHEQKDKIIEYGIKALCGEDLDL